MKNGGKNKSVAFIFLFSVFNNILKLYRHTQILKGRVIFFSLFVFNLVVS